MVEITSPVGRIVWGHPTKGRPKVDVNTKQPILKDGKPVTQWAFGVAFPKADFAAVMWPAMAAEAQKLFPSGQFPQNFAWKYDDGDTIDSKGKPFNQREGYAGCIVVAISTESFEPQVTKLIGPGQYQNIPGDQVKCGDFVRVALQIQNHGPKQGAAGSPSGLYMNPRLIEFVGFGSEIFNGPDATQVFGGAAVALPPGASAVPIATAAAPIPFQPAPASAPAFPTPAPVAPAPFAVPSPATPAAPSFPAPVPFPSPIAFPSSAPAPVPAHDFVVAATAQNPPGMPAMPVAKQQYSAAIGPAPAGYRIVNYSADGRSMIIEQI